MTTLAKFDPFADLADFPRSLRLFGDTFGRLLSEPVAGRPWVPAVDVLESDDAITLKADVPGVRMEDIDIRLENGTLTLKGERKYEKEKNEAGYHLIERQHGSFVRSFALPETVDAEKVSADYRGGVLTVTLPKKEIARPRTVKVKVSSN
jgi:HSP20 family protein